MAGIRVPSAPSVVSKGDGMLACLIIAPSGEGVEDGAGGGSELGVDTCTVIGAMAGGTWHKFAGRPAAARPSKPLLSIDEATSGCRTLRVSAPAGMPMGWSGAEAAGEERWGKVLC